MSVTPDNDTGSAKLTNPQQTAECIQLSLAVQQELLIVQHDLHGATLESWMRVTVPVM